MRNLASEPSLVPVPVNARDLHAVGHERIAVTHDYLDQYGGAERTVLAICEHFRSAPLYTSVYDRAVMRQLGFVEPAQQIVVSFIQRWPLRRRVPRYYLTWLYPLAFRTFDLRGYELILSSANFAAKDLTISPGAVHVSYCYTPPRFLWGFDSDTACRAMPIHERPLATLARATLRRLVDEDAEAYARVSAAYRRPREDPGRTRAVDEALVGAAQTPLATARGAVRLIALAREIERLGNKNARSDAKVGEALARAALAGALENVRVNVQALSEPGLGKSLVEEAERLAGG